MKGASHQPADKPRPARQDSEQAPAPAGGHCVLRLYVTGATPNSARAIANLRTLCEQHLAGHYELEVVDVYQQPLLALQGRILAAPTLVKSAPPPVLRLIGDLSDQPRLFAALDIRSR